MSGDQKSDQTVPENLLTFQSKGVVLAHQVLDNLGLPLPSPPTPESRELTLPQNLGDLSDGEISQHLAMWTNLIASASYREAIASSNAVATAEEVKVRVRKYLLAWPADDKKTTVTEREAKAHMEPEIRKLGVQKIHLETVERLLKAVLKGYEAKYAAISRELSRREAAAGRGRTGSGF